MQLRRVRIAGTGKYLPPKVVTAEELDDRMGLPRGTVRERTGVIERRWSAGETASEMAVKAAHGAMEAAGIQTRDLDVIIGASGTYEQPIPCNAALIKRRLGDDDWRIPAFDINSTCLSFLTALDVASYMIEAGRYERVLLVASEVASVGLNFNHLKSSALFGDGAAAVVVERTPQGEGSAILGAAMSTDSRGVDICRLPGGGSALHPQHYTPELAESFQFQMDGTRLFKMIAESIAPFLQGLLAPLKMTVSDARMVIPHQASPAAVELLRRRLGIDRARCMNIIEDHGNVIAASIPMALHEAIVRGKLNRGDRAIMLGTSAGLSMGGLVFEY